MVDPNTQPRTAFNVARAVAEIALSLPQNPTTGDILDALTRAEAAGFARGQAEQQQVRP